MPRCGRRPHLTARPTCSLIGCHRHGATGQHETLSFPSRLGNFGAMVAAQPWFSTSSVRLRLIVALCQLATVAVGCVEAREPPAGPHSPQPSTEQMPPAQRIPMARDYGRAAAPESAPVPKHGAVPACDLKQSTGPPGTGTRVQVFVRRTARWESRNVSTVQPGDEFIHENCLYKVRGRLRVFEIAPEISVGALHRVWHLQQDEKRRPPTYDDVVYVRGERYPDTGFWLFGDVRSGVQVVFQSHVYESEQHAGITRVQATGDSFCTVTNTYRRESADLVELRVQFHDRAGSITGTADHPFFAPTEMKYIAMSELRAGMVLLTTDGTRATVLAVTPKVGTETVHNLEVAGAHNYFVSAGPGTPGVLVHNTCSLVSRIDESPVLVREAKRAGRSQQSGLDTLTAQLARGNFNPGTGTKPIGSGISEARHRAGARVYFRRVGDDVVEILGKSDKGNQTRVISEVLSVFGGP